MKPHPLFSAPAAQVTFPVLEDFLRLGIEENLTVEYKREGDTAIDAIAAFANTYGGVVLYGIERDPKHPERPGRITGVNPGEKMKLVNKAATTFDPPWWAPEIISVPTGDADKVVLVVRVDADLAPRPVLHKGCIHIRLDGRTTVADRRAARALFDESEVPTAASAADPRHFPDQYKSPFNRLKPPPDVAVRAMCDLALRGAPPRPRLGAETFVPVLKAMQADTFKLATLFVRGNSAVPVTAPELDCQRINSRFLRLSTGHGTAGQPPSQGTRVECSIDIGRPRNRMEICVDALFWRPPDMRVPGDDLIHAEHVMVELLTSHILPAATTSVLGDVTLPLPPVELYVAAGEKHNEYGDLVSVSLDEVVVLDAFGIRYGNGPIIRAGEYLRPDLVDEGRWDEAVSDALRLMAMDWGYLAPAVG